MENDMRTPNSGLDPRATHVHVNQSEKVRKCENVLCEMRFSHSPSVAADGYQL